MSETQEPTPTSAAEFEQMDPHVARAIQDAELDRYVQDVKSTQTDDNIILAERGKEGEAIVGRERSDFTKSEAFVADPADADQIIVYSQIDGTPSIVLLSMLSYGALSPWIFWSYSALLPGFMLLITLLAKRQHARDLGRKVSPRETLQFLWNSKLKKLDNPSE